MNGQGELLTDDLSLGEALRDQALIAVNQAADPDQRQHIDEVIEQWAVRRVPFSLNDLRADLGQNFGNIVGARVNHAARRGLIRDTGCRVKSTLPSTHCAELKVWIGVDRD